MLAIVMPRLQAVLTNSHASALEEPQRAQTVSLAASAAQELMRACVIQEPFASGMRTEQQPLQRPEQGRARRKRSRGLGRLCVQSARFGTRSAALRRCLCDGCSFVRRLLDQPYP